MEKKLNDIFHSLGTEGAYSGDSKVILKVFKKKYPNTKISLKNVQNYLDLQESYSLHRPARRTFQRNVIYTSGPGVQLCADILDFKGLRKLNKGFRYILLVLDVFTRYGYAEGLKTKNRVDTLEAFKKIIKRAEHKPSVLQTDLGGEFLNADMKGFFRV